MILDKTLELSLAQAVTATAVSTNVVDIGSARNIGTGEDLFLYIKVDVATQAAGAATVNFQLQVDDNSGMSSPATLLDSGAIAKASLTAGAVFKYKLPTGAFERYLALNYLVTTGPLTVGAFSAWIASDVQDNTQYPSGFAIS
jgi:hypothetical protein